MVILKKVRNALILMSALVLVFSPILYTTFTSAYSPYCVTDKCRAAEDAKNAAESAAANASRTANTLEAEVARLDSQIAAIEAEIAANEALAKDLASQIIIQENKLKQERAALATLLIDAHFEENQDTIIILAGSESISDLAEKQARDETAKTQISLFATSIREMKEELERQKQTVESIIAEDELKAADATKLRADKNNLITKYKNDFAAYKAQANAADVIASEEIRNELQRMIEAGDSISGVDNYPYRSVCNSVNGKRFATLPYTYSLEVPALGYNPGVYGGVVCQCTGYAGWKVYEYTDKTNDGIRNNNGLRISGWGHAKSWASYAENHGYQVSSTPRRNSVAVYTSGSVGHVMWVEEVISDYSIIISDYNWNPFTYRSSKISTYPGKYRYIYF